MTAEVYGPPPKPAKNMETLRQRSRMLQIPRLETWSEDEVDAWIAERTAELVCKSPLAKTDLEMAEELAFQAASRMWLYRIALAGIRDQEARRDRRASPTEVVKASNVASKITPLFRALGLIVLHKDTATANKAAKAKADPFGDDDV